MDPIAMVITICSAICKHQLTKLGIKIDHRVHSGSRRIKT